MEPPAPLPLPSPNPPPPHNPALLSPPDLKSGAHRPHSEKLKTKDQSDFCLVSKVNRQISCASVVSINYPEKVSQPPALP